MKRLALLLVLLVGCPTPPTEPEPGPLQAGHGIVRMPVPVGIGSSGNNGLLGGPNSPSPYVDTYPATRHLHGHPEVRAVVLSRGEGFEIVLARVDMIAVPQQIRDAVVAGVRARTGRDLEHSLVLSATHTHNGPGRFIQGGLFRLIADTFWPAHYERLIGAMVDAIALAYDDLGPAEVGTTIVTAPEAHNDRRCEDGETYTNDRTPMLVVKKGGVVDSVVLNYAVHGTMLGIDDLTLSQDVSGAIEEHVEQAFDHEVAVLMLNGSAGDMSPGNPSAAAPAVLSPMDPSYDRMDSIGLYLAGLVVPAAEGAATSTEIELASRTVRFGLSRDEIGYQGDEFDYEFGGVYCDSSDATCDEVIDIDGLDEGCIPFPETSPAPDRTMVTVGRIGDAWFTTWSGECGTRLAEGVVAAMQAHEGVGEVFFFGYANDYLGYQLQEADWWHGGYEASGGMWGPKQGDYMAQRQAAAFAAWLSEAEVSWTEPAPAPLFDASGAQPWTLEPALQLGQIPVPPEPSYPADGVVVVEVNGTDPWLGAPVATLQRQDGDFVDVTTPDGRAVDSDGYGFWIDLLPEPSWDETDEFAERRFGWRFSMPLARRSGATPAGTYRLRVLVPQESGDALEVLTDAFEVQAP